MNNIRRFIRKLILESAEFATLEAFEKRYVYDWESDDQGGPGARIYYYLDKDTNETFYEDTQRQKYNELRDKHEELQAAAPKEKPPAKPKKDQPMTSAQFYEVEGSPEDGRFGQFSSAIHPDKRVKYKDMDDTSELGSRDAGRTSADFNKPVGATNAGRVGGLVGAQLFKRAVNFEVTDVTTRGGSTETDIKLNVYDGVRLGPGALDPSQFREDPYTYEVIGNGNERSCEVGFDTKYIYVGKWILDRGSWRWHTNTNLDPAAMEPLQRLIQEVNGAPLQMGPDPSRWIWKPTDRTWDQFRRGFAQPHLQNPRENFELERGGGKMWTKNELETLWTAGGDDYFMVISRTQPVGGRIARRGGSEFPQLIEGHKEMLELQKDAKKVGFSWTSVLNPDVKLTESEKDFKYRKIPTIDEVMTMTPRYLKKGRGTTLEVVCGWDDWNWSSAPRLAFTQEAASILMQAIVEEEQNP